MFKKKFLLHFPLQSSQKFFFQTILNLKMPKALLINEINDCLVLI